MVKRNPHLAKLNAGYLFPEIVRRKKAFLEKHPHAKLISLGIGDTTQPLPEAIVNVMKEKVLSLGTHAGYSGYGPEEGYEELRHEIASRIYKNKVSTDEVFVSDGIGSDIGRLQMMFGSNVSVAIQDPSYPAYVDSSVIIGQTGDFHQGQYRGISYMPCHPENNFFPDLDLIPPVDLIYFCSPNNPTGAVATKAQLKQLVDFARHHHSIIIFDRAYSMFIKDPELPKSIYDIEGANEVAIELGSFSKKAGFTGVRLGWSIVPKALRFEDGSSVHRDWYRMVTSCFNGASNIAQAGGLAVLDPKGWKEIQKMVQYYSDNATLLKKAFESKGFSVYGGVHAPYVWVKVPEKSSWQAFEDLLEKKHILCTPGSGFGPSGEGFVRFSAFAPREQTEEAIFRILE